MSFVTNLTDSSNAAIAAKTVEEQFRLKAISAKEKAELAAAIGAGKVILAGAYVKMRNVAAAGEKTYEVYRLSYSEYSDRNNKLDISGVKSKKVRYIYEELEREGLNPWFEFGHDGCGMESWYMLMVKWP